MLYYYFLKKIVINKWIYLSLIIIFLINLVILPSINKQLIMSASQYQNFVNIFVLTNLAVSLVFSGLILIVLFREQRDTGWELWMSAIPYSRNKIFLSKLVIFIAFVLIYSIFVPLIFLGMLSVNYSSDLAHTNAFYGIVNISQNFGEAFGILLGAYFFSTLFFASLYLIASLYLKQLTILLIVFLSTIIFALFSLVPKINQDQGSILQYDVGDKKMKIDEPFGLSVEKLNQELANNQEIYQLDKTQEYLEDFIKEAKTFDNLLFGDNSFSRLGLKANLDQGSRLNLLNPFTYFDVLTNDLYEKNFNLVQETISYHQSKSKILVAKNTDLTKAASFEAKEKILAKRFAKLQMVVNNLNQTINDLDDFLLYIPNPVNQKEVETEINNLEFNANDIFNTYTGFEQYQEQSWQKVPPLSPAEVNLDLVQDESGNVITLDEKLQSSYLQLLALVQANPNLVYDTEYVDVFPTWGVYLIVLPLIIGFSIFAFYLHSKIRIA